MNAEQTETLRAMRQEQNALRERLEQLERRLGQFERSETPAPPLPVEPPPLPVSVPVPLAPPMPPVTAPPPPPRASVEARIGSQWTLWAGVVILLTALVSGATYLYENVVPHLGPVSKIGLLYLGAGLLAGLGAWLERSRAGRENPRVRNYARVLLAGGLAAVYYVTYAAHYYPNLRVIGSPMLAGLMLIGWAGFIVWLADRRDSQTLASFAILLAFYTSAVNEIADFTLVSNGSLAVAAVFLLRRHLWRIFPFVSLLATYGSYGYWRYFHFYTALTGLDEWPHRRGPIDAGGFWIGAAFLSVYWLLFTWAVFSTPEQTLPTRRRAGFASLNNGAFFLLVTWSLLDDYPGSFWKWALGFGVVLLALAETGRRLPQRTDRDTENAFLLGGALLVTVGFIAYLSGWQLGLMMAVESVLLLAAAQRRANPWLVVGSVATAVLALTLTLWELFGGYPNHFRILSLAVAGLFVFNSWLSARPGDTAPNHRLINAAGVVYEFLALILVVAWGEEYFPQMTKFALFSVAGSVLFAFGIVTRWRRWTGWSYVLTCAGLFSFWLDYSTDDHRMPIHLLGFGCLVAQQQFARKHTRSDLPAAWCPPLMQDALIVAAVLSMWSAWSAAVIHWNGSGILLAASWSLFAAVVFIVGLALHERVYRWMSLLVLVATLGHVFLIDIWQLDSLARFFSLLSLGVVLLAIGFFYTRYQSKIRDIF